MILTIRILIEAGRTIIRPITIQNRTTATNTMNTHDDMVTTAAWGRFSLE